MNIAAHWLWLELMGESRGLLSQRHGHNGLFCFKWVVVYFTRSLYSTFNCFSGRQWSFWGDKVPHNRTWPLFHSKTESPSLFVTTRTVRHNHYCQIFRRRSNHLSEFICPFMWSDFITIHYFDVVTTIVQCVVWVSLSRWNNITY